MTNPPPNDPLAFLLPKLKPDSSIRPSAQTGQWESYSPSAFQSVATSLDYAAPNNIKSISAIPTLWARPLLMEMALHDPEHPVHPQMVEQWQGMLGALALAEVRGFPLKVQLLELGKASPDDPLSRALHQLLPAPSNSLYRLDSKNPWEDLYLFLWQGKPVGMTTPSTLVCPSEEGEWSGVPWWLGDKLRCPHLFLNSQEKALLWRWLGNLREELQKHGGNPAAINRIAKLIADFQANLGDFPSQPLRLSDNPRFFDIPLNRGALAALNHPIKGEPQPSSVRLIPSPEKAGPNKPPLLIIATDLPRAWNVSPQNIWIHDTTTLASLNLEALKQGKISWEDILWIEAEHLLLPKLAFITQENALSGALFPKPSQPLTWQGQPITILLPFDPILLDYFTPADLIGRVQLQAIAGSKKPVVRVTLDLPLSGINPEITPQSYRISKDYPLEAENALSTVPVLEIWPNFRAPGWQEYHAFYYDAGMGETTFQVSFPEAEGGYPVTEGKGIFQIARFSEFPAAIECRDSQQNLLGLILLEPPPLLQPQATWRIGVDMGTSFTNVYRNQNGLIERLELEPLNLQVTASEPETRRAVLLEFFITDNPLLLQLPLATVLTTRGNFPVARGRIYIPSSNSFKPQENWIKTNLKWSVENVNFSRLFLENLCLYISAVAAQQQVEQIEWFISYPAAFSIADQNRYADLWKDLIQKLKKTTGIEHKLISFTTESLAFAQYFADFELSDLIRTTCIDLGGGTSDVSIWQNNILIHQCSVLLGGRDIFSQFLELNPLYLARFLRVDLEQWRGLRGGAFAAKLDVWLWQYGTRWLKENIRELEQDSCFKELQTLMAIGMAGLYYYVGIILGVLHQEQKYSHPEITPVYLGGRGSLFLNWLVAEGEFKQSSEINKLFSRMLSQGSGFKDIEEITQLSLNPKDEVACGLVLNESRLQVGGGNEYEPLIAGENCQWDGQEISWQSRLPLSPASKDIVPEFALEQLVQLPKFLYDFHNALTNLLQEKISPVAGYIPSQNINDNSRLWRQIQRELTKASLHIQGEREKIRSEPPFILGLKALLRVLGKEWARK